MLTFHFISKEPIIMRKRVSKEQQIKFIMECRQSGLSDYQWCEQNDIYPGTFYNWVSKLRKSGYTFPKSEEVDTVTPNVQDVVKVDVLPYASEEPHSIIEQNTSYLANASKPSVAAELQLGDITLKLYNGADSSLIQNTLQCIGGMKYAR